MSGKSKKTSKSNTNSKETNNLLPPASKLCIQFLDDVLIELSNSMLFQVYIKCYLLNKNLKLKETYEINLLNKNKRFIIIEAKTSSTDNNNLMDLTEFSINEETEIDIFSIDDKMANLSLINNIGKDKNGIQLDMNQEIKINKEKVKIIGFEKELKLVNNLIELYLFEGINTYCTDYTNLPSKFINKGILITGNSGIGKSHLLQHISSFYDNINFINFNIHDLIAKDSDKEKTGIETTEKVISIFKSAKRIPPTIILIDDLDKLFSKQSQSEDNEALSSTKTPLLSQFISEIEKIAISDRILIIASSISNDTIDQALLKLGFFDYGITLNSPDRSERNLLWKHFLEQYKHNLSEEDFEIISDISHGYVASDILNVCKNAVINAFTFNTYTNIITNTNNSDNIEKTNTENKAINQLTRIIVEKAIREFKPITLKEIILDIPKVPWSDIGGNKKLIKQIQQSVEWPLKNPQVFKNLGITPPNGILLYGPPGCSKTMIAKALATESGLNFLAVKGPELFSKYVGDSEKAIRDIFKKAKMSSPSIIFFDEIDSMATQRGGGESHVSDKVLCQLLNELDGIEGRERVIIVGATNRPDILDKALIRPGRFDRLIYIPPPDREAREEIFKINISKMTIGKLDIDSIIGKTDGFSGAEMNYLCKEAGMIALDENINATAIEQAHFEKAIKGIKPVITKEMIDFFETFSKKIEIN